MLFYWRLLTFLTKKKPRRGAGQLGK